MVTGHFTPPDLYPPESRTLRGFRDQRGDEGPKSTCSITGGGEVWREGIGGGVNIFGSKSIPWGKGL